MSLPPDRAHVSTEQSNPRSRDLHRLDIAACVERIQEEDRLVHEAVAAARPALIAFLQAAAPGFLSGGRLIYIGAGTSGRLGVLDASECPPTFQLPAGRVIGIIAGGDTALRRSSEGKEDDPHGAIAELESLDLQPRDTLLGIAAGGTTPYVRGALTWAAGLPQAPLTGMLCCADVEQPPGCQYRLYVPTGPELLTGSTRMKAGTATKLILNTITTTLMVQSGRVYGNRMIALRASNDKLRDRAARIISDLTGLARPAAFDLLARAEGDVPTALVMHARGCAMENARQLLERAGRLADVLDAGPSPSGS